MANHSFEIKTPQDFFQALLEQYEEYKSDPLSSRKAILCAILCFHLKEWVKALTEWNEGAFKKRIKRTGNRARFDLFQELCNGSKHVFLNNLNGKSVTKTFEHNGDFSDDFSDDFDRSGLHIEMKDGSTCYFEEEIGKAIIFWKDFFEEMEKESSKPDKTEFIN